MDFLQRNANNQPQAKSTSGGHVTPSATTVEGMKKLVHHEPKWLRIVFVVLLFSIAILTLAIAALLYFGKDKESEFVDPKKQQAVFLTNGQVYFSKVTSITDRYFILQDIYYLNSQQQPEGQTKAPTEQQTSFSLVKLGCELHGPIDQMIVNRDQVSFWENLKSDGKVAKAIDQWVSQNPNGQTCKDNGTSTDQSQSTN